MNHPVYKSTSTESSNNLQLVSVVYTVCKKKEEINFIDSTLLYNLFIYYLQFTIRLFTLYNVCLAKNFLPIWASLILQTQYFNYKISLTLFIIEFNKITICSFPVKMISFLLNHIDYSSYCIDLR